MKTKRKVLARIFVFSLDTRHQELIVMDRAELIEELEKITKGNKQAVQLAKLAWTDQQSDITVGQMRLACIGHMVRETWASAQRRSEAKSSVKIAAAESQTQPQPRQVTPQPEPRAEFQMTEPQNPQPQPKQQAEVQPMSPQVQPQSQKSSFASPDIKKASINEKGNDLPHHVDAAY